jgi:hypothetical protein
MIQYTNNANVEYIEVSHYWSPTSEKYAGCDQLLTALFKGWEVDENVYLESYWHSASREVNIYHFTLHRKGQQLVMPVLSNPYLRRMLQRMPFKVRSIEERDNILRTRVRT